MELKSYDKLWLPSFKGAFLILFGILAMIRTFGTIRSLAILFIILMAMTGILLIATGIRYKTSHFRLWTITSGVVSLVFVLIVSLQLEHNLSVMDMRNAILPVLIGWTIYYAFTEIVEAGILISLKNAYFTLFVINALLTLLFGYFLYILKNNFTEQGVFYIGLIAFVFGIVNILSSYLLSRTK